MKLPEQTQHLIDQYLQELRRDPEHHLSGDKRSDIYETFNSSRLKQVSELWDKADYVIYTDKPNPGDYKQLLKASFLNITKADFALYWLAVLSVEHVLSVYENFDTTLHEDNEKFDKKLPRKILELAIKALYQEISFDEACQNLSNQFDNTYGYAASWLTYEVYCVYEAACYVLNFILNHELTYQLVPEPDEIADSNFQDFALSAMKAYSARDKNLSGEWNNAEHKLPVEFDKQKRLEFWEWWLTEAIPQAWESANRSAT